ncbi:asparagine synthase (glutamine-hydrolyzing) [Mycobacterium riyadhense]|uniref:asparagine synthase (glutamine-hydrolyzing) n=2 Tax=Mycobacterium riyadhense TaxID=486698 RepID=A0A653EG33_9MYCO|nr:asparagine synthase (glutamine-hydrolyzing) [Mycobacterium riyadhense]VTO96469.1 Asparagine synthetase [glutamine-hydrolyzing] 3 [Mycobacterium riyadhense]
MCGIVAIWSRERDSAGYAMKAALSELSHRGPDASNMRWTESGVLLGHTRLAIQDPEHGSQPAALDDGYLAFNGEIYNYPELRQELRACGARFHEHGDTEVLARALDQWGHDAFTRLNGDFAFVYEAAGMLRLVRDRFGVKPLYYWSDASDLVVASEPKAILAALKHLRPTFTPRLDKDGLVDCTLYGATVAPNSLFQDISSVRPGTYLQIRRGGSALTFSESRYWELTHDSTDVCAETLAEDVRRTLIDAVRIRLRSDVGSASMLSGGLDSSIITYIAGEEAATNQTDHRRAYSIGDPAKASDSAGTFITGSDLEFARIVAAESGHELIINTELADDPVGWVRRLAGVRDSVVTIGCEIGQCKLLSQIGERERVILSGEGADEVFLGYFMQTETSRPVDQYYSAKASRLLQLLFRRDFMRSAEARRRGADAFRSRTRHVADSIRNDRHNFIHYLQLRFTLPYMLDRLDTMAMAYSVEARVPYLDHRLVELVFNAPVNLRFTASEKQLLRQAFAGRYNDAVINRKKSVFPYGESNEYLEQLRVEVNKVLSDESSIVRQVYNTTILRSIFAGSRRFRAVMRIAGRFYLLAFMCQLISLDELGRIHGLRA